MWRVRAYFDGFNLYKGASATAALHEDATGERLAWKWLDLRRLSANIAERYWGDVDIRYVAYCTAEVANRYVGDT
jgi:hypothetical protein